MAGVGVRHGLDLLLNVGSLWRPGRAVTSSTYSLSAKRGRLSEKDGTKRCHRRTGATVALGERSDPYSLNSVTAEADADGSITLDLAPEGGGLANHLYVMDGWNYALRLYKPRREVIDKTWTPPTPQPVD